MICSKSKLEPELNKIRSILTSNGYPEDVITSTFQRKLKQLNAKLIHSADKCPVYLHVPWLGNVSTRFENKSALQSNAATSPSNHVLFLQPDSSCHLRRKTCCLPIIAAILFTYLCASVIVGTLVARLNVFKSVSNNTSLNSQFQPAGKAFLVGVKPTILGNFMSLLLVNTFLITLYVLLITMTTNFQFLLEAVLSFIFPL